MPTATYSVTHGRRQP